MRRLLLVVAAAVALAACSPAVADAPTSGGAAAAEVSTDELGGLRYDRIGVDVAGMIPLGLDKDQRPEVPSETDPMVIGWYVLGPTPGDVGPAVVMAHVNAQGKPGAFAHLTRARKGDRLQVQRGDRELTFEVYDVHQADKQAFPGDLAFGDTAGPELRLITCGGELGVEANGRHSYEDNIIVSARLV